MKSERAAAEHRDFLHAASDAHVFAGCRHAEPVRQHGYFPCSVVHFVEPEGHERQTPGVGDDAADADGVILITAGMTSQIGDVRIPQRHRAPTQGDSEPNAGEYPWNPHSSHPWNPYRSNPWNPHPQSALRNPQCGMDRAESWNYDGMRRCQRLPEVTHPVDPTRPDQGSIKSHALENSQKTSGK